MKIGFREFQTREEEQKAAALIGTIDVGEKWIFEGAEGSKDFGGFIQRLYYSQGEVFGAYNACVFGGRLRIQIGFNTDLPEELSAELLEQIDKARSKVKTQASIWYTPDCVRLEDFLFNRLPWKGKGHKTHEFTALREDFRNAACVLSGGFFIVPFEEKYAMGMCRMFDKALAHTFDDNCGVFAADILNFKAQWMEKAKCGECCVLIENDTVVGAYVLKGAEIDLMAVSPDWQGQGLGRQLLRHAIKHILSTSEAQPYLYCIDSNINALKFYKREGLMVTGHSGYISLKAE